MGVFHLAVLSVTIDLIESVRISCEFLSCCRGGSVKYQTCLIFHRLSPTVNPDHGSAHLVSILLPSCQETLAGLSYSNTPQNHSTTGHRTTPTVVERKLACHKQPRPDLVATHQDLKSPCLWLQSQFHQSRTRCKRKRQDFYSNRQAGKCIYDRSVSFH